MGNISSFESDEDSSDLSIDVNLINSVWLRQFDNVRLMVRDNNASEQQMPAIRKKPDLRTFRHTSMYKEVKGLCGMPPNINRPSDKWSLVRAMQRRENGMAGYPSGAFTPNQHRRITNYFLPNTKEKRLMSLESKIYVCKLNKDGSRLITACKDSVIRVYDATKGTYHRLNRVAVKECNYSILDIDFSPCGRYYAYSTWSEHIFIAPIDGGVEDVQWLYCCPQRTFRHGSATCIFSLRFSPSGNEIIAGCNDSSVYVYDRMRNTATHCIRVNADDDLDVNAVSYVSDNDPNLIVSGCDKGIIKLWDLRCCRSNSRNTMLISSSSSNVPASKHVGVFCGHFDSITYIDPRNDGRYLLSNSKDQSIKIWDLRLMTPSDKVEKSLPVHYWNYQWSKVPRDYYNPTSNLEGDVSVMTYRGHRVTQSLLRAKFSPLEQTGQRYIYTGCSTGRIIIYDVLTGQIKEAIEGHKHIVRDLSWHPSRSEIISSSWDTHVNLNTYKYKPKPKVAERKRYAPVRRSRRIAKREGQLDDIEDNESNIF